VIGTGFPGGTWRPSGPPRWGLRVASVERDPAGLGGTCLLRGASRPRPSSTPPTSTRSSSTPRTTDRRGQRQPRLQRRDEHADAHRQPSQQGDRELPLQVRTRSRSSRVRRAWKVGERHRKRGGETKIKTKNVLLHGVAAAERCPAWLSTARRSSRRTRSCRSRRFPALLGGDRSGARWGWNLRPCSRASAPR